MLKRGVVCCLNPPQRNNHPLFNIIHLLALLACLGHLLWERTRCSLVLRFRWHFGCSDGCGRRVQPAHSSGPVADASGKNCMYGIVQLMQYGLVQRVVPSIGMITSCLSNQWRPLTNQTRVRKEGWMGWQDGIGRPPQLCQARV